MGIFLLPLLLTSFLPTSFLPTSFLPTSFLPASFLPASFLLPFILSFIIESSDIFKLFNILESLMPSSSTSLFFIDLIFLKYLEELLFTWSGISIEILKYFSNLLFLISAFIPIYSSKKFVSSTLSILLDITYYILYLYKYYL